MQKKLLGAVLSLIFVACFAQPASALETIWYPGTVPVGLDGRSLGMGGACLAVTDMWVTPVNPAALVFLPDQGVYVGRFINSNNDTASGLGDQTYIYLCYMLPETANGSGHALTYYQDAYDNEVTGIELTHLYTRYTAFQYGYGHRLSDQISLGLNVRRVDTLDRYYINSDGSAIDIPSGIITIDAGAVFRLNKMMTFSILITDVLAPEVEFYWDPSGGTGGGGGDGGDGDNGGDDAPSGKPMHYLTEARILFGGSIRIGDLVLLAVDVDYSSEGWSDLSSILESLRLGAELHLGPIFLRGGLYRGDPTIGLGLRLGNRQDKMEINLDLSQYYPSSSSLASPVAPATCLQMRVYF